MFIYFWLKFIENDKIEFCKSEVKLMNSYKFKLIELIAVV